MTPHLVNRVISGGKLGLDHTCHMSHMSHVSHMSAMSLHCMLHKVGPALARARPPTRHHQLIDEVYDGAGGLVLVELRKYVAGVTHPPASLVRSTSTSIVRSVP